MPTRRQAEERQRPSRARCRTRREVPARCSHIGERSGRCPLPKTRSAAASRRPCGTGSTADPGRHAGRTRRPRCRSRARARRGRRGEDLKLTNLDKPLFPPRSGVATSRPITKRELVRYFARIAPVMLPHLCRAAAQPPSLPERRRRARASGRRTSPTSAPKWLRRWHEAGVDARTARRTTTCSPTGSRRCAGSATRPRSRSMPGPPGSRSRGSRPSRSSTSTPARRPPGTRRCRSPGSTGPRSSTWASAATRRPPASAASRLDPDRAEVHVRRHVGLGRGAAAARSARPCPTSSRGSGRRPAAAARPASTTPRTSRSRRWSRRTPCGRRGRPGLDADRMGRARRPGPATATAGRSARVERVERIGDLFAGAQTDPRTCRRSNDSAFDDGRRHPSDRNRATNRARARASACRLRARADPELADEIDNCDRTPRRRALGAKAR